MDILQRCGVTLDDVEEAPREGSLRANCSRTLLLIIMIMITYYVYIYIYIYICSFWIPITCVPRVKSIMISYTSQTKSIETTLWRSYWHYSIGQLARHTPSVTDGAKSWSQANTTWRKYIYIYIYIYIFRFTRRMINLDEFQTFQH